MEWTNVTDEIMNRFREYVKKAGTDWMDSAIEEAV